MRSQGVLFKRLVLATTIWMAASSPAAADTSTAPADPSNYSRTITNGYEPSTGRLSSTVIEPDNPKLCLRTSIGYDAFGNVSSRTVSNCDGAPARSRIQTRALRESYDAMTQSITVNGQVVSVPVASGTFATSAENALAQVSRTAYDPRFGMPIRIQDPNGAVSRMDLDDFGRAVRQVAADGTSQVTLYCVIATGDVDTSSNSAGCPSVSAPERPEAAVSFTHSEPRDTQDRKAGVFVRTYVDALGRTVRVATESFDGGGQPGGRAGSVVVSDSVYSAQGVKVMQTNAYFLVSGSSTVQGSQDVRVSAAEYDDLGRPLRTYVTSPTGLVAHSFGGSGFGYGNYGSRASAVTSQRYAGATTVSTSPNGLDSVTERDGMGQIVRVTDPGGAQLAYRYSAFGDLLQTRDSLQNVSSTTYDMLGRAVVVDDPDKGVSQNCFDALGQVKAAQNSKQRGNHGVSACPDDEATGTTAAGRARWTTFAYDTLGRKAEQKSDSDTYHWSYDAGTGAVGRLTQSTTAQGVTKRFFYDSYGRPTSSRTDIAQGPSFSTAMAYDATTGRVASETYPTGFKVGYAYTALGFLSELRSKTPINLSPLPGTEGGARPEGSFLAVETPLWSLRQQSADGRVEQSALSNGMTATTAMDAIGRVTGQNVRAADLSTQVSLGYAWDQMDRMTSRADNIGGGSGGAGVAVSESFEYDKLNRLGAYTVSSPSISNLQRRVELKYNALGMMLSKNDVGSYVYPTQGAGVRGAHRPTSIAGGDLQHDLNGNVLSRTSAKVSSLTYTEYDRVLTATGSSASYTWSYDESMFRIKETRVGSNGVRTLWYLHPDAVGGLGYELETLNGVNSHRHFLTVGGIQVGVLASTGELPVLNAQQVAPSEPSVLPANKLEYWHQNHQGSIVATSDHAGAMTARYSYDPFGKRRQVDGSYDGYGTLILDWRSNVRASTGRGFTGHEELDDIGLINMNGRLYDDHAGVFMQADPILGDRFNTQNYSAYAYVLNDPLNQTDLSGMDPSYSPSDPGCASTAGAVSAGCPAVIVDGKSTPPPDHAPSGSINIELTPRDSFNWGNRSETGINQYAKEMTLLAKSYKPLVASCANGDCMKLVDKAMSALSSLPGLQAAQMAWKNFNYESASKAGHITLAGLGTVPALGLVPDTIDFIWSVAELPFGHSTWADVGMAGVGILATPLFMTGDTAAGLGKIALRMKRSANACGCCFVGDTPVLTASGLMDIKDVEVGTLVQARDPESGVTALKAVTDVIRYPDRHLYGLTFLKQDGSSTRIESSDNHPFWVEGQGWVDSVKLIRGMKVPSFSGEMLTVVNVETLGRTAKTYNLTVDDFHTFFAGHASAYVHNMCACASAGKAAFKATDLGYDANKVSHIFQSKHMMDPLVKRFGSEELALGEMHKAAQAFVGPGVYQTGSWITVKLDGIAVSIKGVVMSGEFRISTATMKPF